MSEESIVEPRFAFTNSFEGACITVEVLGKPDDVGLYRCSWLGHTILRHVSKLIFCEPR